MELPVIHCARFVPIPDEGSLSLFANDDPDLADAASLLTSIRHSPIPKRRDGERYKDRRHEDWFATFDELYAFVDKNKRLPTYHRGKKVNREYQLYMWIAHNNNYYKHRDSHFSRGKRMQNKEILGIWVAFCQ
jgi:hypothetical protein